MRRRNMFKKAIELHAMCDLDILIITHDKELNRLMVYNSCPTAYFDSLEVQKFMHDCQQKAAQKRECQHHQASATPNPCPKCHSTPTSAATTFTTKIFTDGDYDSLKRMKDGPADEEKLEQSVSDSKVNPIYAHASDDSENAQEMTRQTAEESSEDSRRGQGKKASTVKSAA